MANSQFIVLFQGDDTDFIGNQEITVELKTGLDISKCSAHFKFLDFVQDFETIPEDGKLRLVFPEESTREFPLGAMDAEIWLVDQNGKRRTVANRIHIVVTKCLAEAYCNECEQAITVVISNNSLTWDAITKPLTANDVFDIECSDWEFRKIVARAWKLLGGGVKNEN